MAKNNFKIVYVDESESDARNFQRFNYKMEYFREVVSIKPLPNINDLIEAIISERPDAVVVDFRLSEEAPEIRYDGGDVVIKFLEERPEFPVFILTTYESDAIDIGPDANLVNEKSRITEGDDRLLKKFEAQIKKYHKNIKDKEDRLKFLIQEQKQRTLNDFEEEEMTKIEDFIQRSLSGTSNVSKASKETSNQKRLTDLLKKADKILERLDAKK